MAFDTTGLDRPPPDPQVPGWYRHPEFPTVERRWDGAGWTGEHRFAAGRDEVATTAGEPRARDPHATGWRRLRESPGAHEVAAAGLLVLYPLVCTVVATASWRCSAAMVPPALDGLGLAVVVVMAWLAWRQSHLLGQAEWRRLASIVMSIVAGACAVLVGILVLAFSCMTLFG